MRISFKSCAASGGAARQAISNAAESPRMVRLDCDIASAPAQAGARCAAATNATRNNEDCAFKGGAMPATFAVRSGADRAALSSAVQRAAGDARKTDRQNVYAAQSGSRRM